jgi:predicted ATPase
VASLVDKSLLRQVDDPEGEPRFAMLETVREYAVERLEAEGDAETWRQRHAGYYLALARGAGRSAGGGAERRRQPGLPRG